MDKREDKNLDGGTPLEIARPRLWQTKSGFHFEPGWTGNELVDSRHERDLRLDGAYPAIDVQVAK